MTSFDTIIEAMKKLKKYEYTGYFNEIFLHPKDFKMLHVNKVSINFMRIIKRNRKLRNNGKY